MIFNSMKTLNYKIVGILAFLVGVFCAPLFAYAATQSYTVPGTYTFTVPAFNTLTVIVSGAGGSGGGGTWFHGSDYFQSAGAIGNPGGRSLFGSSIIGYGGAPGECQYPEANLGAGGCGGWNNIDLTYQQWWGKASGGDQNTIGGGALGGEGGCGYPCSNDAFDYLGGKSGGNGGMAKKTFTVGTLSIGSTVSVTVGAGGTPVWYETEIGAFSSGAGGGGSVTITWTDAKPDCRIWVDENPIQKGEQTFLRWSSAGADTFYITYVGYVTGSGRAQVGPSATTKYEGTVMGSTGEGNCEQTLTVESGPPPSCEKQPYCDAATDTQYNVNTSCEYVAAGSCSQIAGPNFDLKVNGSDAPPPVRAGDSFYFTWTSEDVKNCVPRMASNVDAWWTNGAGVSVGGYLPTTYGNAGSYIATGVPHSLSRGGTYTYMAQCESTIAVERSLPFAFLLGTETVFAATLYDSTPVTATVCPAGQRVVNGRCVSAVPACTLSAPPVVRGQLFTFAYTTQNATSARIDPDVGVVAAVSFGTKSHTAPNVTTPYTMTVGDSASNSATCFATLTVHDTCTPGCVEKRRYECVDGDFVDVGACSAVPSVNIGVSPALVRQGSTTKVPWSSQNTSACAVTGSNDDGPWRGLQSPPSGQPTSAIQSRTIYTISCIATSGVAVPPKSATVNIIPVFEEQ